MQFRILVLVASCVILISGHSATAQQVRSAEQRSADVAVERGALALLDDPDPLTRQNAMKDIMVSNDAILRDAAVQKVAASTDALMKALALRLVFSRPHKSYIFKIDSCGAISGTNQSYTDAICRNFQSSTSGAFSLNISINDENDGSLMVYSMKGSREEDGRKIAYSGKIYVNKVRFNVNLARFNVPNEDCSGLIEMETNADLKGQVQCGPLFVSGDIQIL